jgi:hypothetical protein
MIDGGAPGRVERVSRTQKLLWLGAKGEAPAVMFRCLARGDLRFEDLAEVLPMAWMRSEAPAASLSAWLTLFQCAGYCSDTSEPLRGELTVFRGCPKPRYARGMSWTLDHEVGAWFARRYVHLLVATEPHLYSATLDAADVLAHFVGQDEAEVVVNPATLRKLRRIPCEESSA